MNLRIIEPHVKQDKKMKVCAYARVSTGSMIQEGSLQNQIETYEKLIRGKEEYEFVTVYADQGISGFLENRPAFQSMLTDAREGKIDLIITKSISRFARNTVTILKFVRELKELGVGIFFEEQNINTLTTEGEVMLSVLASFAEEESRSISENNKWTLKKKFERGEYMINTSRFMGYKKDETGDMVLDKEEARIVRRIFEMYLAGMGSFTIANTLNSEGILTSTRHQWRDKTITDMLTNEKYKGDFHIQKYYTPEGKRNKTVRNNGQVQSYYVSDNHPPIVSKKEWEQVQVLMEKARKSRNVIKGDKKYTKRYPYSGMLLCPYCKKWIGYNNLYSFIKVI